MDKQEIFNEIKDLLSQGRTVFLFGAGSSKCAGLPLMADLSRSILNELTGDSKELVDLIKKNLEENSTIEDYMSEIVDHISILNRSKNERKIIINDKGFSLEKLENTLKEIKNFISKFIGKDKLDLKHHRNFIKELFSLRKNKSEAKLPIDFFTLNYDTLIEDAVALEKIRSSDGFNGGTTAYWRLENFDEKNLKARVFKIHGSVDWYLLEDNLAIPMKVRNAIDIKEDKKNLLIWPTTSKYKESQKNPHFQIIQKFRESLCRKEDTILFSVGYSFGDEHINEEILNSLELNRDLTFLIFIKNEPKKYPFLEKLMDNNSLKNRLKIYTSHGCFHGGNKTNDFKIWEFEHLVNIMNKESSDDT